MLTGICLASPLVVLGAFILLWRTKKKNAALAILVGYILFIAFLSSGDVLIEIGQSGQSVGNFLMNIGEKLPR